MRHQRLEKLEIYSQTLNQHLRKDDIWLLNIEGVYFESRKTVVWQYTR
jgi:hypothetical protein